MIGGSAEPYHYACFPAHADWPEGVISHGACSTLDGTWIVVDVWQSQEAFDGFLAGRLGPAFEKVDGMPQPDVMPFQVHNTYHHGQWPDGATPRRCHHLPGRSAPTGAPVAMTSSVREIIRVI
jgi:hypothetical protein